MKNIKEKYSEPLLVKHETLLDITGTKYGEKSSYEKGGLEKGGLEKGSLEKGGLEKGGSEHGFWG